MQKKQLKNSNIFPKNNKGITLIALVITIVVLLILAGVTINIAINNGILNNSKKAVDEYKVSEYKENIEVIKTGEQFKKISENLQDSLKDLVVSKLNDEDWVKNVESTGEENQIKIVTEDNYVIIAKIDENGNITYETIEKDNDEPYPTLSVEVLEPEQGTESTKVKIKVIAEVKKVKNTKKIAKIELIKNGKTLQTQNYNDSKVEAIFEVEENGTYRVKATTDQNKSSTKNAVVNTQAIQVPIQMSAEPTTPRNTEKTGRQNGVEAGPITVTIIYGETDLQKQYQIGNSDWQTVNDTNATVSVKNNVTVRARYYDGENGISTATYDVQNVDNVAPNSVNITTTTTSSSITVSASATDTASEGAATGIAGVLRYEYNLNNEGWKTTKEFTNLSKGTYIIQVKAIDKAGNEAISTKTETIGEISTADIRINATPTTARNTENTGIKNGVSTGPITVTITYGDNNYTKQYKVGNGSWQTSNGTTATVSVTENTTVVARYFDGINGSETQSYSIQNVDNVAPTFSSYNATVNGRTITATANAKDTASDGAASGIAGILRYEYSIDEINYQESNTFTVNTSGNCTVYIKAIDKAGNETIVTKTVELKSNEYTLTLIAGTGIESVTGGQIISEGEKATIKATMSNGYVFDKWEIISGTGTIDDETSSTTNVIVTSNMTIKAIGIEDKVEDTHRKLANGDYAYNNPVIPIGFKMSKEGASWKLSEDETFVTGWNDGLVIEDEIGNQFVWVPVDGENVKFERRKFSENDLSITPETLVELADDESAMGMSIIAETAMVNKYQGFYIGRYEAGHENANSKVIVSKKNYLAYGGVSRSDAITYAKSMCTTSGYVGSGLLSGRMWDTTMIWIAGGTTDVALATVQENSSNWGVYYGNGLQKTGALEKSKKKNIYDLAGNLLEYTAEKYTRNGTGYSMLRGGSYKDNGDSRPAAGRWYGSSANSNEGFRVALYIE